MKKIICEECNNKFPPTQVIKTETGGYICNSCIEKIDSDYWDFWTKEMILKHKEIDESLGIIGEHQNRVIENVKYIISHMRGDRKNKSGAAEAERVLKAYCPELTGMQKQHLNNWLKGKLQYSWKKVNKIASAFVFIFHTKFILV